MSNDDSALLKNFFTVVLFLSIFLFILFVNGAVPFYAIPTLGQAIWTTGFSQSFINENILTIYANNIGVPTPAAIAFGLAGAWPIGLLINLGLHPADAYSSVAVLWLGVAYFSAYKISRFFGGKSIVSILMAGLWLTMPTIWKHAGYSMVSWGIALLSFYYYRAIKLLLNESKVSLKIIYLILSYIIATIISVFMDGYSFVMFVVGVSILIVYVYLFMPQYRRNILTVSIPTHIVSVISAYYLYTSYIGKSSFNPASIDFFRGWGLDLSFIAIPSKDILWLFDILGLSVRRTTELYFGDASVWVTTFSLPIILVGIFSWWSSRKLSKLSSGLLIIAVFSFYMSLGPSLKINSTRPIEMLQVKDREASMSADLAIFPTGNAWISENIPGFNAMRASYRWSALGIFLCWLIFSLYLGKRKNKNNHAIIISFILIMILCNLPNLFNNWKQHRQEYLMFLKIDSDLVSSLANEVNYNDLVAFLPYQNDFMINYLASRLNVRAYNIGGDKNLEEAQKKWPATMLRSDLKLDKKIKKMLLNHEADTIVIPYFDTLWAAHYWPCTDEDKSSAVVKNTSFKCPHNIKNEFIELIKDLKSIPYLSVNDKDFFATVKINPAILVNRSLSALKHEVEMEAINNVSYPIKVTPALENADLIFENWNSLEPTAIWSKGQSVLNLPVPNQCQKVKCNIILDFGVLNASAINPVIVKLSAQGKNSHWQETLTLIKSASNKVSIPLPSSSNVLPISIEVLGATSPQKLGISKDTRTLGIYLHEIILKEE